MLIFKFKPKNSSLNLAPRLAFVGLNLTKLKFKPRKPKNRHNFLNLKNIVDKLHLIKYKFKIFVAIRAALLCARTLFGGGLRAERNSNPFFLDKFLYARN